MPWTDSSGTVMGDTYASPAQVGGGIINATAILEGTTSVNVGSLALNDTAYFKADHTITITNSGSRPVLYTFTHEPAGSFGVLRPTQGYMVSIPDPMPSVTAQVMLPEPILVQPFSSRTVNIKMSPPTPGSVNVTAVPVYGGNRDQWK